MILCGFVFLFLRLESDAKATGAGLSGSRSLTLETNFYAGDFGDRFFVACMIYYLLGCLKRHLNVVALRFHWQFEKNLKKFLEESAKKTWKFFLDLDETWTIFIKFLLKSWQVLKDFIEIFNFWKRICIMLLKSLLFLFNSCEIFKEFWFLKLDTFLMIVQKVLTFFFFCWPLCHSFSIFDRFFSYCWKISSTIFRFLIRNSWTVFNFSCFQFRFFNIL